MTDAPGAGMTAIFGIAIAVLLLVGMAVFGFFVTRRGGSTPSSGQATTAKEPAASAWPQATLATIGAARLADNGDSGLIFAPGTSDPVGGTPSGGSGSGNS